MSTKKRKIEGPVIENLPVSMTFLDKKQIANKINLKKRSFIFGGLITPRLIGCLTVTSTQTWEYLDMEVILWSLVLNENHRNTMYIYILKISRI